MGRQDQARRGKAPACCAGSGDDSARCGAHAAGGAVSYADFLAEKAQLEGNHGFSPVWLPEFLFDFQAAAVEWATLKGRAALFEDCGLGKTVQELVWAENVVRKTGGRVLLLTPLAVTAQIADEAK